MSGKHHHFIPPTVGKDVGLVEGAAVGLMLGLSVGLPVGIICRLMEHVLSTASRMSSCNL
jgi:tetrahydromethanopterin S-methyltransferase subunit G